jgi:hypothetical protein
MPTIQIKVTVAANAVSANVVADQLYRFIQRGRPVRVSCKASATGIKSTVLNGIPVVQDQDITFNATNQFPIIPDDVLTTFQAPGGELFITHRNTTGAGIDVVTKVEIA